MQAVGEVQERKGKENRFGRRYGFEIKLRCVKLYLEEGLPLSLLAKEVGASTDGIRRWVKAYRERGEEGFRNPVRSSGGRRKLPGPVRKLLLIKEIYTFLNGSKTDNFVKQIFVYKSFIF